MKNGKGRRIAEIGNEVGIKVRVTGGREKWKVFMKGEKYMKKKKSKVCNRKKK